MISIAIEESDVLAYESYDFTNIKILIVFLTQTKKKLFEIMIQIIRTTNTNPMTKFQS